MARIFGMIPAAGQSSRMGRPKLLLPLGGQSVLERVIASCHAGGVEEIVVVVAPGGAELARQAEAARAHVVMLTAETLDMRATVEHGLAWLENHVRPGPADGWLLSPADHPALDGTVICRLTEARAASPQHSVFLPTFQGQRGHPALIGWAHLEGVRRLPAGQGLNTYLRAQAAHTLLVPVESASILCDLNTPEEYARLLERDWS
jgi:molybdenum cofactor cytidylyltransferase